MRIDNLDYLTTIAAEGNISKAAQKLYISQPALSKSLASLEEELGAKLFLRLRDRVVPTAAGKIYIEAAKKMSAVWNETTEMISQISQNLVYPDVRIGINNSTAVTELMLNMVEHLQTEMPIFYDVDSVECTRMLREGLLDIASLIFPDGMPDDFQCLLTEPDELAVAVPTTPEYDYINMRFSTVLPIDLLNGAKAFSCRPDCGLGIVINRYLSKHNVSLVSICNMSVHSALIAGVENGAGLALMHRSMLRETSTYRIYTLDPPYKYEHKLCSKKGAELSPKVKRIVNLLWNQKIF